MEGPFRNNPLSMSSSPQSCTTDNPETGVRARKRLVWVPVTIRLDTKPRYALETMHQPSKKQFDSGPQQPPMHTYQATSTIEAETDNGNFIKLRYVVAQLDQQSI